MYHLYILCIYVTHTISDDDDDDDSRNDFYGQTYNIIILPPSWSSGKKTHTRRQKFMRVEMHENSMLFEISSCSMYL